MRKLRTKDIPAFCRIVKNAGIDEQIKSIALKASKEEHINIERAGVDIVLSCIGAVTDENIERDIYSFLGSVFEMTPAEVSELELDSLIDKFKEMGRVNNLKAFFSSAMKSMI